jgi:hypothetical protein
MSMNRDGSQASALEQALRLMREALATLDEDGAVGIVAAHLDLACVRLDEHLALSVRAG